jgi:multidrug efflux pump subunit AcrA (membrane-fusion protein)
MGGKIEVVARHGAIALYNALEHRRIFLLPVWRVLGDSVSWFTGQRTPKAVIALILIVATTLGLVFVPWPLRLEGRGELVPENRRTVYAPVSGTVREVRVEHADRVDQGTLIAVMSNPELERELAELEGKLRSSERQQMALTAEKTRDKFNAEIDGKIVQEAQLMEGLKQQIQMVNAQMTTLEIDSPIHGQIMDWKPKEKLAQRPVQQGDALLEVAQVDGRWVLEIELPENTVTHIAKAQKEKGDEPLAVTFVVSASPDRTYHGKLIELSTAAHPIEQENVIEAKIALDEEQGLPPLVSGVEVRVKVDCGPHAVGYVLFREVIDFVREYVFF